MGRRRYHYSPKMAANRLFNRQIDQTMNADLDAMARELDAIWEDIVHDTVGG